MPKKVRPVCSICRRAGSGVAELLAHIAEARLESLIADLLHLPPACRESFEAFGVDGKRVQLHAEVNAWRDAAHLCGMESRQSGGGKRLARSQCRHGLQNLSTRFQFRNLSRDARSCFAEAALEIAKGSKQQKTHRAVWRVGCRGSDVISEISPRHTPARALSRLQHIHIAGVNFECIDS